MHSKYDTSHASDPYLAEPGPDHLSPELAVAYSLQAMNNPTLSGERYAEINAAWLLAEGKAIAAGDLSSLRRMLAAQTRLLERMSHHLFAQASNLTHQPQQYDRMMRLALRAQAQCGRTTAILAQMTKQAAKPDPTKRGKGAFMPPENTALRKVFENAEASPKYAERINRLLTGENPWPTDAGPRLFEMNGQV